MISLEEARIRVARGAAHLDQVRPGWQDRIDVGTLTLHDPCGCIVGQLARIEGGSFTGVWMDILHGQWTEELTAGVGLGVFSHSQADYAVLQDAWIEAIAARRHPVVEREPALVMEGSR